MVTMGHIITFVFTTKYFDESHMTRNDYTTMKYCEDKKDLWIIVQLVV